MVESVKGTRDFLPEQKIAMQRVADALRSIFETYGFNPAETACLEDYALLSAKYSGGAEILNETYKLTDRGGRNLGLRYDLTVPLARLVAENKQLAKPFKRYEFGKAWRDGPTKVGRYREFWQCDVDTVGSESMLADAELVALTSAAFEKLGFDVTIKVNNRKLLDGVLENAGVPKEAWASSLQSLDKLTKMGEDAVRKELADKGIDKTAQDAIFKTLRLPMAEIGKLNALASEGAKELVQFFEYAEKLGVRNAEWSASLSRGLDYYTGTVFEAYLKKGAIKSSLAGGGRYDKMIAALVGVEKLPAVGISFGLDVIIDALDEKESRKSVADVLVIPISKTEPALEAVRVLRAASIKTDVDLASRSLTKNLEYASSLGIPYCVIVGPKDAAQNAATVRDMKTGEQKSVKISELTDFFLKK